MPSNLNNRGTKHATTELTPYRGKQRSVDGALTRITVTLPDDLLESADRSVVEQRRQAKGFNRSALIEMALRAYLEDMT